MNRPHRRITYRIVVTGPDDEHKLETVTAWGLDGLIELFSQEGYEVKDHEPPIISLKGDKPKDWPPKPLPRAPDNVYRTGTKPGPAQRQRPPTVPAPRRKR